MFSKLGYRLEENLIPLDVTNRLIETALTLSGLADYRPIPMPHRVHSVFLEFLRYKPIVRIVEDILGGTASGLGGEYFFMKPGTLGFAPHQDNTYVQAPPNSFISVWTALVDVEEANGALVFYPGSHKLGQLETRATGKDSGKGQNPGAQVIESILSEGLETKVMTMKRGSVVFFHSLLVHASKPNTSDRFRHSYLGTYLLKGSVFRPGASQNRTEVDLEVTSNELDL